MKAEQCSRWQELRPVRLVLESLGSKVANEQVCGLTENQNIAKILLVGSTKALLQKEACAIFALTIAKRLGFNHSGYPILTISKQITLVSL